MRRPAAEIRFTYVWSRSSGARGTRAWREGLCCSAPWGYALRVFVKYHFHTTFLRSARSGSFSARPRSVTPQHSADVCRSLVACSPFRTRAFTQRASDWHHRAPAQSTTTGRSFCRRKPQTARRIACYAAPHAFLVTRSASASFPFNQDRLDCLHTLPPHRHRIAQVGDVLIDQCVVTRPQTHGRRKFGTVQEVALPQYLRKRVVALP